MSSKSDAQILHEAVRSENYDKIKRMLIEDPTLINAKGNTFGQTALFEAVCRADVDAVNLMISLPCSKLIDANSKDVWGKSPIDIAAESESWAIERALRPYFPRTIPLYSASEQASNFPLLAANRVPNIADMVEIQEKSKELLEEHNKLAKHILRKKEDKKLSRANIFVIFSNKVKSLFVKINAKLGKN